MHNLNITYFCFCVTEHGKTPNEHHAQRKLPRYRSYHAMSDSVLAIGLQCRFAGLQIYADARKRREHYVRPCMWSHHDHDGTFLAARLQYIYASGCLRNHEMKEKGILPCIVVTLTLKTSLKPLNSNATVHRIVASSFGTLNAIPYLYPSEYKFSRLLNQGYD